MPQNQNFDARNDNNQQYALIGHQGTAGTETRRVVVNDDGSFNVQSSGGTSTVIVLNDYPGVAYNNIQMSYPNGTTDVATYLAGTAPVGTVTIEYTGTARTDIDNVNYA